MNFLTATVELETDDSRLNAQLAKVKQKVTKSVEAMEKYFKKNVTHSFRLVTPLSQYNPIGIPVEPPVVLYFNLDFG